MRSVTISEWAYIVSASTLTSLWHTTDSKFSGCHRKHHLSHCECSSTWTTETKEKNENTKENTSESKILCRICTDISYLWLGVLLLKLLFWTNRIFTIWTRQIMVERRSKYTKMDSFRLKRGWLDSNQEIWVPKTHALPFGDTPKCQMYMILLTLLASRFPHIPLVTYLA